jgi:diadenosine tetraphosphatase ApaH/serine/threonine PP2A family protein phosphatase
LLALSDPMRYLVLSDIHANIQALDAVLADAAGRGYTEILCLGDFVGYGGDPETVLERLRDLPRVTSVRGNHDKVAAGLWPSTGFSADAGVAIEWTSRVLSARAIAFLTELPKGPRELDDVLFCHGAPFDEDYYIFSVSDARRAARDVKTSLCLFGHTHVCAAYNSNGSPIRVDDAIEITGPGPWLVNVGSAGQPRDGDPRAAYGILDTDRSHVEFYRVEYDIPAAQRRIRDAGLPPWLAERLAIGR